MPGNLHGRALDYTIMITSHQPISNAAVLGDIEQEFLKVSSTDFKLEDWNTGYYQQVFVDWINSGTLCSVTGIEKFPYIAFTNGTTQALESFISHWRSRRLRVSRAEFQLPRVFAAYLGVDYCYLEDDDLSSNDFVIVSLPFSGNGSEYPGYQQLLEQCKNLSIPVCLDLAYIGIAHSMSIDLSHPAIAAVTTSISKPYSTMLRHGVRFTCDRWDDSAQNLTEVGILPRANIRVASSIMNKYGRDYIPLKYLTKSKKVCGELGIVHTNVVTLACGDDTVYKEFNRGGYTRICITNEIES